MLKTREELKQTLAKIEELRTKYGINYIDSRTSDALANIESTLSRFDLSSIYKRWTEINDNLLTLLTSPQIARFSYTEEVPEDMEGMEDEAGNELEAGNATWTVQPDYFDVDGEKTFKIVEDGGFT
ncbi:MAG: hypothetical protein Nk1A_7900 [Endomicrobiia bacterium]|nr:MAG: hypothetical protein Nk1A_7900 [Endomicrobiia bacterium]